jgi:hypothetical protein
MSSYLDDCTLQVFSVHSSIAPSESASQSGSWLSGAFKNTPLAVGYLVPSTIHPPLAAIRPLLPKRARSRSVKEQLATIDEGDLPLDASLLLKMWMENKPHVKAEWLH